MNTIISEAIKYTELEKSVRDAVGNDDTVRETRIVILGCGGAGLKTLNRLHSTGARAETIAIDMDKQVLDTIRADKRILIGKTLCRSSGAGGNPEIGKRAADMARPTIEAILENVDILFIISGFGGGVGTGATPVIAQIARERGAIVIPIVTYPFYAEKGRCKKADNAIKEMISQSFPIVLFDNNNIDEFVPNLPVGQAFSAVDQIISQSICDIIDTIVEISAVNINISDLRSVMKENGFATLLFGETEQLDKVPAISQELFCHPMIPMDFRNSRGILVQITCGPEFSLAESKQILSKITEYAHPAAEVVWGLRIQSKMEGKLRVVAIITGIQKNLFSVFRNFLKI